MPADYTLAQEGVQPVRDGRHLWLRVLEPDGAAPQGTAFTVHGSGGRSDQWRFITPALVQAGWRVVEHDGPGHGRSPQPRAWRAYDGQAWADDLAALMARQGTGRTVVIAHSYGCLVTLAALVSARVRVEQVVLLAPPVLEAPQRAPALTYYPTPLLALMRPRLSAAFRSAAWGSGADPALVAHETAITDRNSLRVFKALWRQRLSIEPSSLSNVTAAVSILAGADDRITPPDLAHVLAGHLARATVQVLPGCGHQILLEQPRRVIDAVHLRA